MNCIERRRIAGEMEERREMNTAFERILLQMKSGIRESLYRGGLPD